MEEALMYEYRIQELEERIKKWHEHRFPNADQGHVALKLSSEAGEVADAILAMVGMNSATGDGNVPEEVADVFICGIVLMKRWFPSVDIFEEIEKKLMKLETPGAHRASLI